MHHLMRIIMIPFLAGLLGGCSKQSAPSLPGTKTSGDLVPFVMRCATRRGAYVTTNTLPVIQASWIQGSKEDKDIIFVDGDHFSEVQKFLERAYGAPNIGLNSATFGRLRANRLLIYNLPQVGVVLELTANSTMTVVTVRVEPTVKPIL